MAKKYSHPTIEKWSYTRFGLGLVVEPPKTGILGLRIQGHVYNHPSYDDGEFIVTAPIKEIHEVRPKVFMMEDGEIFILGEIDAKAE